MKIEKYALLDTDFISKTHFIHGDTEKCLVDLVVEMPGYCFFCHSQIIKELSRHNQQAIGWLQHKISEQKIQCYRPDTDFHAGIDPAMTISNGRLRFNTACLKKFENVEYVELLLNSVERCIAIRPCDKNNPNAIRWGRLKEGRWCASTLGCRGLAKTLFDIMEWDEDLRYRFRGQFLEQGDNKMMLFAFDEPEMIKVEEIVLPPKENTEEDEGETVKKKIYIFPPEWAGTFGQPITSIAQVGILRQEHYAGNWDVFRPATEIEEMNIFTAESLNELLREAEKIMEGWTDYR